LIFHVVPLRAFFTAREAFFVELYDRTAILGIHDAKSYSVDYFRIEKHIQKADLQHLPEMMVKFEKAAQVMSA
jgi:hypothetical protein